MQFNNPLMLWTLPILLVLVGAFCLSWKIYRRFEQSKSIKSLRIAVVPAWKTRGFFSLLKLTAFFLLLLSLAEPMIVWSQPERIYENVRIFFVVDVSRSMVYAEDIKPNRLAATKKEMLELFEYTNGYQVSLLPFAGAPNSYYCPPTTSRSIYTSLTKKLSPAAASALGTDLPLAIESLKKSIVESEFDKSGVNIVIVLTDGGKEESIRTNRSLLLKNVTELSSGNSKFFFVGIGGEEPTPLIVRGNDGEFLDFIPGESGNATSQLDRSFLMSVAQTANSEYYSYEQADALRPVLLNAIQKNQGAPEIRWKNKLVSIQPYLFALSSLCFFAGFIFNKRRR